MKQEHEPSCGSPLDLSLLDMIYKTNSKLISKVEPDSNVGKQVSMPNPTT